jgi:hypothetical protein
MTTIQLNPDNPAPTDIARQIVSVDVSYVNFENEQNVGVIEVNQSVETEVREFFKLGLELKFPIEKVVRSSDQAYQWDDDRLISDNASSGFNYRFIKDTQQPSLHGLGYAIDINPRLNPYIRYNEDGSETVDPIGAVYDPAQPGALMNEHPLVVFMKERGWEWGGDWTKASGRIDYQHFEKKRVEEKV